MRRMQNRRRTTRSNGLLLVAVVALGFLVVFLAIAFRPISTPQVNANIPSPSKPLEWNEAEAPNYYLVAGEAEFDALPPVGSVSYSPLDGLGRAGMVMACVDATLVREGSSRERKNVSGIFPSGWGSNGVVDIELPTGGTYHGHFWNRSHLLAKSLGGDEVVENLICGTRMQNVGANVNGMEGGMAYPEALARDWLNKNPNGFVYYSAMPEYLGSEPVCRDVVVNVLSSDGSLNCKIVVFNAAKGYAIDYATGRFAPE